MDDLFSATQNSTEFKAAQPLAERARPEALEDFVGQAQIIGDGSLLKDLLISDHLPSLILWGPSGTGKTSFAHLVSKRTKATFVNLSAVDTGARELKAQGDEAKRRLLHLNERTILFIDEIHRLNKAQQDVLLPFVEKGYLSLIGATTENPSFELNSALLSRSQVVIFQSHDDTSIGEILDRGLKILDPNLGWKDLSEADLRSVLIQNAAGDGRRSLNLLESLFSYFKIQGGVSLKEEQIKEALRFTPHRYDKSREMHYDTVSAFIKSLRGSDPDGALYYLVRMLKGGEDPLFIARRLVILASEDVGNADPRALTVAIAVKEAVEFVGMPEASINLAQAVTYLATAPKSNRSYLGLRKAEALVDRNPNLEIPLSIRNAPTKMMKDLGYGKDYLYAHDSDSGVTPQKFLPEQLHGVELYKPTNRGHEKNITTYLEWVKSQLKNQMDLP